MRVARAISFDRLGWPVSCYCSSCPFPFHKLLSVTIKMLITSRMRFTAFAAALVLLASCAQVHAAEPSDERTRRKLDISLRKAVDEKGDTISRQVIVQVDAADVGRVAAMLTGR